jgi:isopenicillin N synthase-like dioxygenase
MCGRRDGWVVWCGVRRNTHRVSVPFFYEPNFDAWVEPIPQLCGPPHAPPQRHLAGVRYGDHLQRKVFSNFELPSSAAAAS